MLDASGKAKLYYNKNGFITAVRYHADDRSEALDHLRAYLSKGATIVMVARKKGYYDAYALKCADLPTLGYISKPMGSVLGETIYDGSNAREGFQCGFAGPGEAVARLAEALYADRDALRWLEIV